MDVIHPENDAPVDNMKLHKDLAWVVRGLAGLIVIGFLAGVWATTLASDVSSNSKELEKKADQATVAAVVETLARIEKKIDDAGKEQKTIRDSVIRLETKVEKLEEENGS